MQPSLSTSPAAKKSKVRYLGIAVALLVVTSLALLSARFVDGCRPIRQARAASAEVMLRQIAASVAFYKSDLGEYPAGDGSGSASLLKCLGAKGPKQLSYFEVSSESLDSRGDLLTPVEEGKVYYYRAPGVHNPKSFDLWCEDAERWQ